MISYLFIFFFFLREQIMLQHSFDALKTPAYIQLHKYRKNRSFYNLFGSLSCILYFPIFLRFLSFTQFHNPLWTFCAFFFVMFKEGKIIFKDKNILFSKHFFIISFCALFNLLYFCFYLWIFLYHVSVNPFPNWMFKKEEY